MSELQLFGKVVAKGKIEAKTGLRIGGTSGGLKIGGLDLNVITDPDDKPYIPGSSLKGKMRSLLEQHEAKGKNYFFKDGKHVCTTEADYKKCPICKIWGTIISKDPNTKIDFSVPTLTRLIVRDAFLLIDGEFKKFWERVKNNIEMEYTEVKVETAIDRVKGSALDGSLRQIERVPAGATFGWQFTFNVFDEEDKNLLKKVFEALELLENDYLGGMGSRGYGQVEVKDIEVFWNSKASYESGDVELKEDRKINNGFNTPSALIKNFSAIKNNLK